MDVNIVQDVMGFCQTMFPVAKYATSYTPTYPLGQSGYVICTMDPVSGRGRWDDGSVGWEV